MGVLRVCTQDDRCEVVASIFFEPDTSGCQTGVALDGSESMRSPLGQGWSFSMSYSESVSERLVQQGCATRVVQDGVQRVEFNQKGWDELLEAGLLVRDPNLMEPIAREVIPYLTEQIAGEGTTAVLYWGCGAGGDEIEVLGEYRSAEARAAKYEGPKVWGEGACLLPALRYFVDRFAEAAFGFYVFIADGKIEDFEALKEYTAFLAGRIASEQANPLKCVLIGVGALVDKRQLFELDQLSRAQGAEFRIWSTKMAATMRDLQQVFEEAVDDHMRVAPCGRVRDEEGYGLRGRENGLPAKLVFTLPKDAVSITLEVDGRVIGQPLQ